MRGDDLRTALAEMSAQCVTVELYAHTDRKMSGYPINCFPDCSIEFMNNLAKFVPEGEDVCIYMYYVWECNINTTDMEIRGTATFFSEGKSENCRIKIVAE